MYVLRTNAYTPKRDIDLSYTTNHTDSTKLNPGFIQFRVAEQECNDASRHCIHIKTSKLNSYATN